MECTTSGDESCVFASLRRNDRFGERDSLENDEVIVASLLYSFRSLLLGDRDLKLLDFLKFDLFGNLDLCDKRFYFLFLRFMDL